MSILSASASTHPESALRKSWFMADISKRLDKAERYLQKGKSEAALDEYLAALEEDPRNGQIRQTAADLCLAVGRGSEAASLLSYLFEQEAEENEIAKGIVTYKKLSKISVPTPLQTFYYAQMAERKDKREALEAYETALAGFEKQRKAAEALAAARRIVELAPTMENLQRAGDKAALLGEGNVAAACFVRLGQLKDEESPNSGFPWYDRAYNLDPLNLEAVLQYARGLFSRGALAECIDVLHPAVTVLKSTHEVRELYAHALMAARRPVEAEPYAWELYEKDSRQLEEIASLVGVYLDIGEAESAVALARRIDERESRAGRQREFLTAMYEVGNRRTPARGFCEYLAALLNSANREHEYSQILLKLFTAYCADGEYARAGDTLDRAAELDPYEPGHAQRLQALRGHISPSAYNSIARRFQSAASSGEETVAPGPVVETRDQESEPTVLEDFILQAEIYLQYGMRSKAMERLERISKLFPGEEHNNEKLRHLYLSAGFTASSATGPPAKKAAGAPAVSS